MKKVTFYPYSISNYYYCVINFSGNQYRDTNGRKWIINESKYSKRTNRNSRYNRKSTS